MINKHTAILICDVQEMHNSIQSTMQQQCYILLEREMKSKGKRSRTNTLDNISIEPKNRLVEEENSNAVTEHKNLLQKRDTERNVFKKTEDRNNSTAELHEASPLNNVHVATSGVTHVALQKHLDVPTASTAAILD